MKKVHNWLKYGALASSTLILIFCAALVLQVLTKESNMRAGILTFHVWILSRLQAPNNNLQFDFTSLGHPATVRGVPQERNVVQGIETAAAAAVTTAIHGAISQAASIAIPSSVEALIPRNCSLGIKEFCVGSAHDCFKLPLNLASIIPTDVAKFFHLNFNDIESLNTALAKITIALYDCLVLGSLSTIVMVALLAYSIFYLSSKFLKAGIHITLGLICFALFIIPVVILYTLDSKVKQTPPWIQVEYGKVYTPILVSLICVSFVAILNTIISVVW